MSRYRQERRRRLRKALKALLHYRRSDERIKAAKNARPAI
jgi:hypothetical protein